jgi:beta-glucanase (GH16 family)
MLPDLRAAVHHLGMGRMMLRRCSQFVFAAAAAVVACGSSDTAAPSGQPPPSQSGWQLAWSDEFDGADGSAPNPARWVFDIGGGGWGNNELQSYTDRRENAAIRGGALIIRALRETFTGTDGIRREYTSARLKTQGTFTQAYGRFEARLHIPRGQGIWPAFWMLGEDITSARWPACGEIDIMENIGREPSIVHGTIHGPGYSGGQSVGGAFTNPNGRPFADDFHVFTVEWDPQAIRWYVDGAPYQSRTPSDLPGGGRWVFDHPFFMLLNVAVGGNWPGNPDSTTTLPQEMRVDWMRVYRRTG